MAHHDIVGQARDLIVANRVTRDIVFDRSEPARVQLVARKRGLRDLFRKKTDPFAVNASQYDAWMAEIARLHPARSDLLRQGAETPAAPPSGFDLPRAAEAMVAEKPDRAS